jgi:hypothetical protein
MRSRSSACLAASALFAAGCGPAPYAIGPEDQAPTVDVAAPRDAPDRWLPETFPHKNPFTKHRVWDGVYDCTQGRTQLTLRVTDARDNWVRAIFDFHHPGSGAAGKFFVAGRFDVGSGRLSLAPGPWIDQPEGYESVGLEGLVSPDGREWRGRITHEGCGSFRVRAAE